MKLKELLLDSAFDDIRERIKFNISSQGLEYVYEEEVSFIDSKKDLLIEAFVWSSSIEGTIFWLNEYRNIKDN